MNKFKIDIYDIPMLSLNNCLILTYSTCDLDSTLSKENILCFTPYHIIFERYKIAKFVLHLTISNYEILSDFPVVIHETLIDNNT